MKKAFKYMLPLLPVIASWVSCTDDREWDPQGGKTADVIFSVRLPQLKSGAGDQDSYDHAVNTLDVLAFECSSDTTFLYRMKGQRIGEEPKFRVSLKSRPDVGNYVFYVLVNAEDLVQPVGPESAGEKAATIRKKISAEIRAGEKWNAPGGIPMWGCLEKSPDEFIPDSEYPVSVLRMLAKVNLGVEEEIGDDFKIREAYLYNYHTKGYVVPEPEYVRSANTGGKKYEYVDSPTVDRTWTPAGIREPVKVYDALSDGEWKDFYLFEALQGKEGDYTRNVCLVVGAELGSGGAIRYFRIDFADAVEGYVPVRRNFLYEIRINDVKGNGHEGPEEAYYSTSADLDVGVTGYEDFSFNIILEEDRFVFMASDSELVFHANESGINQDAHLTITTNHPDGWRIDKITRDPEGLEVVVLYGGDSPEWFEPDFWLRNVDPVSSLGEAYSAGTNGYRTHRVVFDFGVNESGADRTVYIHISYGRNSFVMPLTQKAIQGVGYTTRGEGWMQIDRYDYKYGGSAIIPINRMESLIGSESAGMDEMHIPTRSEVLLLWVYERAFDDEKTGLPFEDLFGTWEEGYKISANTTYWTNSHKVLPDEEGHSLSWINMARGKVECINNPTAPPSDTYGNDEYLGGIGGRRLRFVRRDPGADKSLKYPYTLEHWEGPVIVSRYAGMGVAQAAIRGGLWIEDHHEHDLTNTVSAVLQVDNTDVKDDSGIYNQGKANELCKLRNGYGPETETGLYDWRLPTQRELQLIYLMGGMKENEYDAGEGLASFPSMYDPEGKRLRNLYSFGLFEPLDERNGNVENLLFWYWTATKSSGTDTTGSYYWSVSSSGRARSWHTGVHAAKARCVRTLRTLPRSTYELVE